MSKKYRIIEGPESIQGSPEWLAFRKNKITATMLSNIMGVGYLTPLELFELIVFDKSQQQTEAMRRGSEMEIEAREWYNSLRGHNYQPAVVQSLSSPLFIASLDGYREDSFGVPYILEIKCDNAIDHAIALSGNIPDKHYPQVQGQMEIVDCPNMVYISYRSESQAIVVVNHDKKYCKQMYDKALEFHDCLIDMKSPKPTDRDFIVERDESLEALIIAYNSICEEMDDNEATKKNLKEMIVKELDHPRVKIGKNKVQLIHKKGEIDYLKAIEDLGLDIDLEKYRKPSSQFWKISY